jgi:hypothetical protein
VLTNVIVGVTGAFDGAINLEFVNFNALLKPVPQPEVYATLTLSLFAAAVFKVYFILTIRDVNDPESTTAFLPNTPTKDHSHPVAVPVNAGAV